MDLMRFKSWASKALTIGILAAGFWLGGSLRVTGQAPFLLFGNSSGTAQVIKSTSNALWVSVSGVLGTLTAPVTLDSTATNAFRIQMTTPSAPTMTQNQSGTDLAAGAYATALVALDPISGVTLPTATQTVTVGAGGAGRIVFTFSFPTGSTTTRAYVSALAGVTPDRYFTCTASPCNVDTLTGATVAALPSAATAYRTNIGGATANWMANPLYFSDGAAKTPSMTFASRPGTGFFLSGNNSIDFADQDDGIAVQRYSNAGITIHPSNGLRWGASNVTDPDLYLTREAAATLQFGIDTAGVTNQIIKSPDRITSDGVGGNLTITGGRNRGASAGGSIIFQTSPAAGAGVTGTLATVLTISSTALTAGANIITPAGEGLKRFLCIDENGVITSQAAICAAP